MRRNLFLFVFFCLVVVGAGAQELTITGMVTASSDGQPMPFVTVSVNGTSNGVTTDMDGKYSIQHVSASDSLVFSFVGYTTKKFQVGSQKSINVKLESRAKELNEVVVTALGVVRQKRELGYATTKIKGDEIKQSNSPNLLNAMTGKVAGVQIANPDGVDGGTTRIIIRGINSISGDNQPLIVVDGMPLANNPGLTGVGRGQDWGSPINNINMDDVEEYQVLNGGAASALYGAIGANGAILITMKKGRKQSGIGVSYNMSYRITHPYRYRDVQNKYGAGAPSTSALAPDFEYGPGDVALFPALGTDADFGYPGSAVSWGPEMKGQPVLWWDGIVRSWSPQPDNLSIPYRDGKSITHNVAVEGGGDIGTMRVSISRTDNTPIVYNSNYDQTTVNLNSSIKATDKLQLSVSTSYLKYNRVNAPMLGEDASGFTKGLLYSWPRSYRGEDLEHYQLNDGTRHPQAGFPYLYIDKYLWWEYYNNNTTLERDKLLGTVSLNYAITPWLSLMGRTGIDLTTDEYVYKHKPADVVGLLDGYYGEKNQHDQNYNSDFLFTAKKEKIFKSDFNVSFSVGGSTYSQDMRSDSAHSGTWYYPNWYSLSNYTATTYGSDSAGNTIIIKKGDDPTALIPVTAFSKRKINSLYSFVDISFKDYLFLQFTARNDWSSTLPDDANSYFYPGVSISYIISDALKFKKEWFSYCKLRGGAAQTGNDTKPYQTEFYYNTSLFGGVQSSTFPSTIPPFALKPQRVNEYEAGTVLGFFNDRITLDLSYYYKHCYNQIITDLPVAGSSGSHSIKINDGVLTNQGIEVLLNATVLQKKNFIFKTGINFSNNRNKVKSLAENVNELVLADIWGENGPQIALTAGDDYGTIVGWDYVYKNGQPVVNEDGTKYLITDKRVPIGNASPDFLAGWTTEFSYKDFTLRTLINTQWGGDIYCGSYVIGLQTGQSPETLLERDGGGLPYTDASGNTSNTGVILQGVHEDGTPNTTVVSYIYKYMPAAGGWGHFLSKPGIVENTWVKMREISLTYNLPERWARKTKVFQSLSLTISGRDLFYLYTTIPDNINPEGLLGAGNAQGFEWGSLPGTRSFSFAISAHF